MKKKSFLAILFVLVIFVVAASADGKAFNSAKIKDLFSKNSAGDWEFTFQNNSSDCITNLTIQLDDKGNGKYETILFGFYYSKSDKAFLKTTDYTFTIDGHKFYFGESAATITLDTNLGKAECAYIVHPLINDMLKELKNAKEVKVGIGFEMWGIKGISVSISYSGNDTGLKTLKALSKSLSDANYFSNLTSETSIYAEMLTATESYE